MSGLAPVEDRWGFVHRFVPGSGGAGGLTLLLLHGTGGGEDDLIPLARQLAPGAALLSPRGKVLEHGMPRWFRRLAPGVFDEDDLQRRARELAAFVGSAAGHYGLDAARIIALGYSNGANIASAVMLLEPGLLAGGILLRPMVPFEPSDPPDLSGTRVLLAGGRHDPIAPPDHVERLAALLRGAGSQVTIHWHAGGHELGQDDLRAAGAWLGPGPAGTGPISP